MQNINSFAENVRTLTDSANKVLSVAEAMNESITGNAPEIYLSDDIKLPSFSNVLRRLDRVENTVAKFTQGKGVVETDDGTYRKIKVTTVSTPPTSITGLEQVNAFSINPNWFFESFQYPRCVVKLDLTPHVEESSDRAYVTRVIIPANQITNGISNIDFYRNNIAGQNLSYNRLIDLLEENGIEYMEDKDEVKFPLTYEKYDGRFTVVNHGLLKDEKGVSRLWYYLNTLSYATVDESGQHTDNGNLLSLYDYIRFNDSLFKVIDVDQKEKRIRLEYAVGYATIGDYDVIELYNPPFAEKVVEIGIGINEIDIVYVKGVNEEYNLISREWSNPVSFYTNELTFENDENETFDTYYSERVADFGKRLVDQLKEGQISAYSGLEPNAPVLNADDFRVVQINTQLEATLDMERYNNLTTQISSTKSNITAVRNTISENKDLLIQTSDSTERDNIQNVINSDTESLDSLTTQYTSLVEELDTLLTDANIIKYNPKYHIRGFFAIPEARYLKPEEQKGKQTIIGFEIMYRYLHTDETGTALNTFDYTVNDTISTGVFSDWNIMRSDILTKKYNPDTDSYQWIDTDPMDGTQININQIDIPIRNGEKVQIKIRSISEAGYPYNPLKSDWSNSVIISFPDDLTTDDSVTTILETVRNDMTAVVLQETMTAAGVYTHLADSNSTFKHSAANIEYTEVVTDEAGKTTVTEMSLQDKVKQLSDLVQSLMQ
jgi:hypothetical protein